MIELNKFEGPFGVPIYYQQMPEMVKAVSMSWVVFTGAADDQSVGEPGLYHWFEHIPFRGTKKYPGGYSDVRGRFTKYGGRVGAYTGKYATVYHALVPVSIWKEGLSVITDLLAQPLITDDAVHGERSIIHQEIAGALAKAEGYAQYHLPAILAQGHPSGHPVLGSEASLNAMEVETLRRAHQQGYDRSRCAFFMVGNVPFEELQGEIHLLSDTLPNQKLSERRVPAYHGENPWPEDRLSIQSTSFTSSMVYAMFPLPGVSMEKDYFLGKIIRLMLNFGVPITPLYRILREERKLVYRTFIREEYHPGGGCIGLVAEAKKENITAIVDAFRAVVKDSTARSSARLDDVKQGLANTLEMKSIDPENFMATAVDRYVEAGRIVNDSDYMTMLKDVTLDVVSGAIETVLDPEKARVILFEGEGK